MLGTKAAKRYAKALFSLAEEQGVAEEVSAELAQLASALADPALAEAFSLPMPVKTRRDIADQVVAALSPHPLVGNFFYVLAENDRLNDFANIEQAYQDLLERAKGRIRARVRSARPLSPEEMNNLLEAFRRLTHKAVLPTVELDPELLGGVVVEIEGRVYDASLKTQLQRLGETLAQQL